MVFLHELGDAYDGVHRSTNIVGYVRKEHSLSLSCHLCLLGCKLRLLIGALQLRALLYFFHFIAMNRAVGQNHVS